jgi:hypothetical protein
MLSVEVGCCGCLRGRSAAFCRLPKMQQMLTSEGQDQRYGKPINQIAESGREGGGGRFVWWGVLRRSSTAFYCDLGERKGIRNSNCRVSLFVGVLSRLRSTLVALLVEVGSSYWIGRGSRSGLLVPFLFGDTGWGYRR